MSDEYKLFTVFSYYMATGEGHTYSIWCGYAPNPEDAKKEFVRVIPHGEWHVQGAEVFEGIPNHPDVQGMLTSRIKRQLMDENSANIYSSQLYYNYS